MSTDYEQLCRDFLNDPARERLVLMVDPNHDLDQMTRVDIALDEFEKVIRRRQAATKRSRARREQVV